MRIFTLILSAVLLAGSISAMPVRGKAELKTKHTATIERLARKAPVKSAKALAAPISDVIVEEAPAGEAATYTRSSVGYANSYFWIDVVEDEGLAAKIIRGTDGKVWFNNPLSQFTLDSYFYGTEADGVITIPGGQCVYREWDEDYEEWAFGYLVGLTADDSGEATITDDIDFQLKWEGDKLVAVDPNRMLGLCGYGIIEPVEDDWEDEWYMPARRAAEAEAEGDAEAQPEFYWIYYGDQNLAYEPMTAQPLAAPAALQTERWQCVQEDGSGYFVNVGEADGKLWLQGLYSYIPEAWVALTLEGDKATLLPGTFLGEDTDYRHFAFAQPGRLVEVYDEEWEEYVYSPEFTEQLDFTYDAQGKTLAAEGLVIYNTSATGGYTYLEYLENPSLCYKEPAADPKPATPNDLYLTDYFDDYGYWVLEFNVPTVDAQGALLDSKDIYYQVLIDGEPYTFTQEEYPYLEVEEMTDIPFAYKDYDSFFSQGIAKAVYLNMTGFETVGVRSLYVDANGNKHYSDIASGSAAGVDKVLAGKNVAKVEYFDLAGRRVARPSNGVYVARTVFTDGTVKTAKLCK